MRFVRPGVTVFAIIALLLGILGVGFGGTRVVRGDLTAVPPLLLGVVFLGLGVLALVVLAKDPSRGRTSPSEGGDRRGKTHVLSFQVGDQERHTVVFSFDQTWGWLTIKVDDVLIVKKLVTLTARLVTAFEFSVGRTEVHEVRIEKHRALVGSFARPQPIKGFVDGVLVAENNGVETA